MQASLPFSDTTWTLRSYLRPAARSLPRWASGSSPERGKKRVIQIRKTTKPEQEPEQGWTVFHAEGPTWLILFALFASILTVVLLAIILGGGFE